MDSNFTRVFVEIAEIKNITKAASNLGYTQSGLSHIINRAETELGFKLFHRAKSGVTLTPEGKILLPAAKEMEHAYEKLYETISSIQGVTKGHITIGTIQSVSITMLPYVLKEFKELYPEVQIDLKEGSVREIHKGIMDHSIDLCLTSIQDNDEFDFIPIYKDPMVAVIPPDFPLKNKDKMDISEFENEPFIMNAMETENDCDVENVIKKNKINVDVKYSSKDCLSIMSMVENGLGITILPELITKRLFHNIKSVPLDPPYIRTLGIGIYSLDSASPTALKFIEFTKSRLGNKK